MAKRRDSFFSDRMSDHEALMWNIEKDPWLNPNGSALTILDQPVDMDRFRQQLRYGVAKVPRLYERVVPGLGRFSPPAWMPDAEFNFDHHVLEVELPSPGTERQLLDLVTQLSEEPLDRSRPLWRFVVIGGLEDGRGAIWSIFHHVVSDGIGQMRMAELYQPIPTVPDVPDLLEFVQNVQDRAIKGPVFYKTQICGQNPRSRCLGQKPVLRFRPLPRVGPKLLLVFQTAS